MKAKDSSGNNNLWKKSLYLLCIAVLQLLLTSAHANSNSWDYPVSPYTPGSYGGRTFYYDSNHLGEDVYLSEATPVRSIGAGYIKEYRSANGYGELVVVIEHDLGQNYTFTNASGDQVTTRYILSIYGHLRKSEYRGGSPLGLGAGQWVDKGTVIGYVNDDANNGDGGEHLHMGIRLSNAAIAKQNDSNWFRGYEGSSGMGKDFAAASSVLRILKSEAVEVRDFWQKVFSSGTNGYLIDCKNESNFDAQFKLTNNSLHTITEVALAAHYSDGSHMVDLKHIKNLSIAPGQSYPQTSPPSGVFGYGYFKNAGDYQIVAKAYYNNTWHHLATKSIKILPNPNCSNTTTRYWSGTGSLISYHAAKVLEDRSGRWGLGHDYDGVHPGKPAAFFQWQVDTNGCSNLEISVDRLSGTETQNVDIILGMWNGRSSDTTLKDVIFRNRDLTKPVVIPNRRGDKAESGDWNVVMVAFNNPISTGYAELKAECTTAPITVGKSAFYAGEGDGTLYDGTYKWYGNGSILSDYFILYYNNRNDEHTFRGSSDWPFGAFKDVVPVKASAYKPVVFFQWLTSDNCKQLNLTAYKSGSAEKRTPAVDVKAKPWSARDSQTIACINNALPCTVDTSQGNIQVIEVKFKSPASEDLKIQASCPGVN
ncbi:MAG: M23 family metallopeptidase [Candidatus Magnetobacterium sp. LHC-1]